MEAIIQGQICKARKGRFTGGKRSGVGDEEAVKGKLVIPG
jgi:hypothetical protein